MTNAEMVQKATAQLDAQTGHSYNRDALESAISAGLIDGDKISANGRIATVSGGTLTVTQDGKQQMCYTLTGMPQATLNSLLILKGIQAAQTGTSMGSV